MPIKLAMLSEKRGLMWVIIGFSDLFSGNLLQEEMEHRNVRFAEKQTWKGWAGDPEPPWDDITARHFGELLLFKNKDEKLTPVWDWKSHILGSLSDLGQQGWLVTLQLSPTLFTIWKVLLSWKNHSHFCWHLSGQKVAQGCSWVQ